MEELVGVVREELDELDELEELLLEDLLVFVVAVLILACMVPLVHMYCRNHARTLGCCEKSWANTSLTPLVNASLLVILGLF